MVCDVENFGNGCRKGSSEEMGLQLLGDTSGATEEKTYPSR